MSLIKKNVVLFTVLVALCTLSVLGNFNMEAEACSNVLLNSKEYIVSGRTMDFEIDLKSEIVVVPAGQIVEAKDGNGSNLISWKSKYGFVGVNAFRLNKYVDGLNERGLSIAGLWLPETKYPSPKDFPGYNCIPIDLAGEWILGNFSTVREVKEALQNNTIITTAFVNELKMVPPLHFAIHDENGESIVVEFTDGKINIYDNSAVKVMTNDPDYSWHLDNLKKYDKLTNKLSSDDVQIKDDKRFIEAFFLNKFVNEPKNLQAAIADMTAIMNKIAVVRGEAIAGESTYANLGSYNYTLWTVIRDHKNKVFYFNDADNLSLRSIDLNKVGLKENDPKVRISLVGGQYHQPMEGYLK